MDSKSYLISRSGCGEWTVTNRDRYPLNDIMPLVTVGDKGNADVFSKQMPLAFYDGLFSSAEVGRKQECGC